MTNENPILVVLSGPEEGERFTLDPAIKTILGRSLENEIILKDNSISRKHLSLEFKNQQLWICDLGSSNGTWLGTQKLKHHTSYVWEAAQFLTLGVYKLKCEGLPRLDLMAQEADVADLVPSESAKPSSALASNFIRWPSKKIGLFLGVLTLMGLGYFGFKNFNRPSHRANLLLAEAPSQPMPVMAPEETSLASSATLATQAPEAPAQNLEVTLELFVKAAPFPAEIYWGETRLGPTPLKKNIQVKVGETIEIHADFELEEINDIYRVTQTIVPALSETTAELVFDAPLASFEVKRLPRRSEFSLKGYSEYDTQKEFLIDIPRISYSRVIYLPFGNYELELKENDKRVYYRDLKLNAGESRFELSLTDADLKSFPVALYSEPSGASVYLGDEKLGLTPFEGFLPLGKNPITFKKDGYFNQTLIAERESNTPFSATLELTTSKVGEFIALAKEKQSESKLDEALALLLESLKYGGSDSEKAHVYFELGKIYFEKNDLELALGYLGRAELVEDWTYKSKLVVAQVLAKQNQVQKALVKLAEVMVLLDEDSLPALKQEAQAVYKQISPVQSALYIYCEPSDALVYVNDKLIDEAKPLLMTGLGLGHYRIRIEKIGYETYYAKQTLKISEFAMIKVKLKKKDSVL